MTIVITCVKGAMWVDEHNNKFVAKTTCIIKKTPFSKRFFLTNGMEVSRKTCFERIKK